jgi:polyisoprenyl-phosphate glycosyltransferase
MKQKTKYSIIIPVYNSAKSLNELITRIHKVFLDITSNYEIILIDDCSTDSSWNIIKKLHQQDKKVKIIQLMKNFGQHNALMCGFNYAKGKYIITMDDDLQHPPEEIPKLIEAIKKYSSYDVIIGKFVNKNHNILRNLLTKSANILNSYFYHKPTDLQMNSFRIIKSKIIKQLIRNKNPNPTIGPFLLATTLNIKNIILKHNSRKYGTTTYSLSRFIKIALDNILHNSTLPLRIVSLFGIIVSFISIALGIYFLYLKIFLSNPIAGWTSLVVLILFLSGITLLSLGFIGEYLIRIIQLISYQEQFLIRQKYL